MKKKKKIIAGALTAAFLSICTVGITTVKAGETVPVLRGSVATSKGVPAKGYPVIIKGTTTWGEDYSSFATTDDSGVFQIMHLPAGQYSTVPAGQPQESGVAVTIAQKPWYEFWKPVKTTDVGALSVTPGPKINSLKSPSKPSPKSPTEPLNKIDSKEQRQLKTNPSLDPH